MRKIDLDNIRWSVVLLVLFYHVCYMFNGVGVLGGVPDAPNIPAFDAFAGLVYPWLMALLFVAAGVSARYSLQKRSNTQFLAERTRKLLVPSTLGLLVVHWITGFIYFKMSGDLEKLPTAAAYPVFVLSGTGPLWFIQTLFLFSCVLVLLRKIDRSNRLENVGEKANFPILLSLSVVVFAASQILNAPVLTMYRFGIYFAAFVIGYVFFARETVQKSLEKFRKISLLLASISAVIYAARYSGDNFASSECLQSVITNLYLWSTVLAIFGYARKYFSRETAFTRYMTASSFGIYILHYPILISVCYFLRFHCNLPTAANYAVAFGVDISATFAAYEIVKRIPVLRYCVLGIKKNREN